MRAVIFFDPSYIPCESLYGDGYVTSLAAAITQALDISFDPSKGFVGFEPEYAELNGVEEGKKEILGRVLLDIPGVPTESVMAVAYVGSGLFELYNQADAGTEINNSVLFKRIGGLFASVKRDFSGKGLNNGQFCVFNPLGKDAEEDAAGTEMAQRVVESRRIFFFDTIDDPAIPEIGYMVQDEMGNVLVEPNTTVTDVPAVEETEAKTEEAPQVH